MCSLFCPGPSYDRHTIDNHRTEIPRRSAGITPRAVVIIARVIRRFRLASSSTVSSPLPARSATQVSVSSIVPLCSTLASTCFSVSSDRVRSAFHYLRVGIAPTYSVPKDVSVGLYQRTGVDASSKTNFVATQSRVRHPGFSLLGSELPKRLNEGLLCGRPNTFMFLLLSAQVVVLRRALRPKCWSSTALVTRGRRGDDVHDAAT